MTTKKTTKLRHMLTIKGTLLSLRVDTNIVIVIVMFIILGVNAPLNCLMHCIVSEIFELCGS